MILKSSLFFDVAD